VDKNLLRTNPASAGEVRFEMLETIREFALEQASLAGEINVLQEKAAGALAALTSQAIQGLRGGERSEWMRRLEGEYPNLLAVIEWGLTAPPGSSAWMAGLQVLADLRYYWMFHGSFHFAERWIERGRAAVEIFSFTSAAPASRFAELNRLRAGIYSLSGSYAWALGDYESSRQWHQRSHALFADLRDEAGMGEALNDLAVCLHELGDYQNALQCYDQAIDLHRQLGDRWGQMRDLNNLGSSLEGLGRLSDAMEALQQGLRLAYELKDRYFVIPFRCNIAHLHIHQGEHFKAGMLLERCKDNPEVAQFPYLRAWVLALLASAQMGQGQSPEAAQTLREVLPILEQLGDADLKQRALLAAAELCLRSGKAFAAALILGGIEANLSTGHRNPFDQAEYESMLKKMRLGASRQKFESALAIGRSMPLEETVGYALRQANEMLLPARGQASSLTPREHQVLTLLAQGKSNEEIANELVIVLKTVEKHVGKILQKLGAKNRTEAAGWVLRKSPPQQPL
jgi:DNA-binding CsgD family transcriptional regulator